MRLAVLGSGDAGLRGELHAAAAAHPDSFAFVDGYDEALSHLLFAGGDLFLMPSRFEPCGLTQMQAMRYGAVPVVTGVGGLVDTVPDADATRATASASSPPRPTSADLLAAMFRAGRRHRPTGASGTRSSARGMSIDWSWAAPASEYIDAVRDGSTIR